MKISRIAPVKAVPRPAAPVSDGQARPFVSDSDVPENPDPSSDFEKRLTTALSHFVPDDRAAADVKADARYGKRFAEVMHQQRRGTYALYDGDRERFPKLRMVAAGHDPAVVYGRIQKGKGSKISVIEKKRQEAGFERLHFMEGILNAIVGKIIKKQYESGIEVIDENSHEQRQRILADWKAINLERQIGQDVTERCAAYGITPDELPEDEASMEYLIQVKFVYESAKRIDKRVKRILDETEYKYAVRATCIKDSLIYGLRAERNYMEPSGRTRIVPCLMEDMVFNADFMQRGLRYAGQYVWHTSGQLRALLGHDLPENEWQAMKGPVTGVTSPTERYGKGYASAHGEYGQGDIAVLHFEVKFDEEKDYMGRKIYPEQVYEGLYCPAGNRLLQWGPAALPRVPFTTGTIFNPDAFAGRQDLSYRIYQCGGVRGDIISIVAQCEPFVETIFQILRNAKIALNTFNPSGYRVNVKKLRSVIVGGETFDLLSLLELFKLSGLLLEDEKELAEGAAPDGSKGSSKPAIERLEGGLDPSFMQLMQALNEQIAQMLRVCGLSSLLQGQAMGNEISVGVSEMAMQGTEDTLAPYYLADLRAFGDYTKFLALAAWQDYHRQGLVEDERAFNFLPVVKPTQQQWEAFFASMEKAVERDQVDPIDEVRMRSIAAREGSLWEAELALTASINRKRRQKATEAQQNAQMTFEQQAETARQNQQMQLAIVQLKEELAERGREADRQHDRVMKAFEMAAKGGYAMEVARITQGVSPASAPDTQGRFLDAVNEQALRLFEDVDDGPEPPAEMGQENYDDATDSYPGQPGGPAEDMEEPMEQPQQAPMAGAGRLEQALQGPGY